MNALKESLASYTVATQKIQELVGIQGMRKDVKESQKEFWTAKQLHAQYMLASALQSCQCTNGSVVAAAILPSATQLTHSASRREALLEIRRLLLNGSLELKGV